MSGFPDKFISNRSIWILGIPTSKFIIQHSYSLFKFSPSFGGEILKFWTRNNEVWVILEHLRTLNLRRIKFNSESRLLGSRRIPLSVSKGSFWKWSLYPTWLMSILPMGKLRATDWPPHAGTGPWMLWPCGNTFAPKEEPNCISSQVHSLRHTTPGRPAQLESPLALRNSTTSPVVEMLASGHRHRVRWLNWIKLSSRFGAKGSSIQYGLYFSTALHHASAKGRSHPIKHQT